MNEDLINYQKFVLVYDISTNSNLDLPYDIYDAFVLDLFYDDECKNEVRFCKKKKWHR